MRHQPTGHTTTTLAMLIVHGVFSLVVLAALITLAIILVKKYRKGKLHLPKLHHPVATVENDPYLNALKILNERLANGDCDVDDYYARRAALKGPDPDKAA